MKSFLKSHDHAAGPGPLTEGSPTQEILLARIRADDRAQPRASLLQVKVEEYRAEMAAGDAFPPVVVFHDGDSYWLADGFHRFSAARALGAETIRCDVREGGLRDAILYSCGANADHGLKRSNEDKRRAVMRLLDDEQWRAWSDREIARAAQVDNKTVATIRGELHLRNSSDATRTVARGGTTYKQRKPYRPSAETPLAPESETVGQATPPSSMPDPSPSEAANVVEISSRGDQVPTEEGFKRQPQPKSDLTKKVNLTMNCDLLRRVRYFGADADLGTSEAFRHLLEAGLAAKQQKAGENRRAA
jgi:ParB-like chromosome segregation protein Spo0J